MRSTHLRRLGVALALALPVVAIAPAATNAGFGEQIVGTVVNSDGVGVEGIRVSVCPVNGSSCVGPSTDASGHYTYDDYANGFYNFWLFDDSGVHIRQVWPSGQGSNDMYPTSVDYTGGGDQAITHTIARRPTIEGSVTDNFGNALAGIDIRFNGPGLVSPEVTDDNGRYMTHLDEGDYTVSFNLFNRDVDYANEWWDSAEDFTNREVITAAAEDEIIDIDASLYTWARITGTVTDETGTAIQGATVQAFKDEVDQGSVTTEVDGTYSFPVRHGDYKVTFISANHVDEGWDDVGRFDDAAQTEITVTEGQIVTGISPQLAGTGVVTGTVTETNGAPIAGVEVRLQAVNFFSGRSLTTDTNGSFTANDMTPGDYQVRFEADSYFTEFYDDTRDEASATPFVVTAGTSVLNASLQQSAVIDGQIVDHLGQPRGGRVTVTSNGVDTTVDSDTAGNYRVSSLANGQFAIRFADHESEYVPDFLRTDDFTVRQVGVTEGATTTVNYRFQQSSTVAGTITGTGVGPLDNVSVFVCRFGTSDCGAAPSSTTGEYLVDRLLPGPYSVRFQAPQPRTYSDEYYDDVVSEDRSTVLDITEGSTTTAIDAELSEAGSISGFVTHPDGRGVFASELLVEACSERLGFCSGPRPPESQVGNAQGRYTIVGLPPATDYAVKFDASPFAEPGEEKLLDEWYNNAATQAAATLVTVISGSATTGIDASLATVANPDPDPDPAPDTRAPFFLIEPTRLADTRPGEQTIDGKFNGDGIVGARQTYEVEIAGRPGVPLGATAAVVNITATGTTAPGFATIYPCDLQPLAASLTYGANDTRSNEIITKLSATGTICIYSETAAHYVIDAVAFVSNSPYVAISPARYVDTRTGEKTVDDRFNGDGIVGAQQTYEVEIAGRLGVPANATAAVINLSATGTTAPGFAIVYPCDLQPLAASLTYGANDTRSNEIITKLSATGTICIYSETAAHYVVDAVGYLADSGYTAINPQRFVDTRAGENTIDDRFAGGGIRAAEQNTEIDIAGRGLVPTGASSVVLNLSVTGTVGPGFITLSTCGQLPLAAALTFGAFDTRSNEVVATLTDAGSLCAYTSTGAHLVIDVVGFS